MSTTVTTTTTKASWQAAVSAVVGATVSWLITEWAKIDVGFVAAFTVPLSYAYHWLIVTGEKKFPWLSFLLLSLPQNLPKPVTPPAPATKASK